MIEKLKAPFPAFGGKATVADVVWSRLGNVDNFIEPFFNSGAVLLLRPGLPRIETANDLDVMIANFWRSTQQDPEAVVDFADQPINEADMHARHRWLVLSDDAKSFRKRMRADPDYFDAKVAGWWCWGLCAWIGSGWCAVDEAGERTLSNRPEGGTGEASVAISHTGKGACRAPDHRKPRIDGGHGQFGHGIHAKGQLPQLSGDGGAAGRGIHSTGIDRRLQEKRPMIGRADSDTPEALPGVLAQGLGDTNRPQLADAYSRGRGVNGNDLAGTCAQRRAWLLDWFHRLRDRLRTVRVCCGDWLRVCDSESVTTRLGVTGIFFDPPYGKKAGRTKNIYAVDSLTVADAVRKYCLERGRLPGMRIALCGYAGEGHEVLKENGWECVAWKSQGGYGNRSAKGKANAKKERIWFSPHCEREAGLYDSLE